MLSVMSSNSWFAITASTLWVKMFATMLMQGVVRLRANAFRRPEDAAYFGGREGVVGDPPLAALGQQALRNDLENIPMFLLLLWGFVSVGGDPSRVAAHGAVFVVARFAHTAWYLRPRQPNRNWSYSLGALTVLSLTGHIVYRVAVEP